MRQHIRVAGYSASCIIHLISVFLLCGGGWLFADTYYVAVTGSNGSGDGSAGNPWGTIGHALENVSDGDLVLVGPGEYFGRVELSGTFSAGVTVRSEIPYQARLRNDGRVVTAYASAAGCEGITIEGFDIAHDGDGAGALVFHLDGGGDQDVRDITIRNNVLHDSYDNDVLKINHACDNILVEGNIFYNQHGEDEHIDINSVTNVTVQDNIFFNDFAGSGRPVNNNNSTSSFIVIKDSNGDSDTILGSHNINIRRNIFFNWQGHPAHSFVMVGEDGHPHFEAYDVLIENNLMLGNADNTISAALTIRGSRDITFRSNTISGDLPARVFALHIDQLEDNQENENLSFYNNIWTDPAGSMGASSSSNTPDFSDTDPSATVSFVLENNLYWNDGQAIPYDEDQLINYSDDPDRIEADPQLAIPANLPLPRWIPADEEFGDGSQTIREVFERLVADYGALPVGSAAIDAADAAHAPADDILGNDRQVGDPDVGSFEYGALSALEPVSGEALPAKIELARNYPNPFNPETVIRYQLFVVSDVELTIYNILGQPVRTLVDQYQGAGHYAVTWNGRDEAGRPVSGGAYFYRLKSGNVSLVRKMVLLP